MTDFSKFLIWVLPNHADEQKNLEEKVYYEEYQFGKRGHQEFCSDFIESHHLEHQKGESHTDYAEVLTSNGFIMAINSGVKIDGKYFCQLFLPEELSDYQIEVLESQREVFATKFYQEENFFHVVVYTSEPLNYRSIGPYFRDLTIEATINNDPNRENGQALLYQYLDELKKHRAMKK